MLSQNYRVSQQLKYGVGTVQTLPLYCCGVEMEKSLLKKAVCLVDVLLGPPPLDVMFQNMPQAVENKPCVLIVLLESVAKLAILHIEFHASVCQHLPGFICKSCR